MNWSIKGRTLYLHHPKGDLYWIMPEGYQMPSASLLSLAQYILLSPHGEKIEIIPGPGVRDGRTAVAFSGGVDSAAALRLIKEPIPIYTQVANPSYLHKIENALLAVDEVKGIAVVSNSDQLPLYYGKRRGVFGFAGFTITCVLLAEHFGLNTFADGNILEFVYLRSSDGHGTKYVERKDSKGHEAFAKLGMHYCMPCAGLTEISTTRIAKDFMYMMGCLRGQGGEPCMKCVKCYRKMAIAGTPIPSNPEVEKILAKDWIPVLGAYLWARDNHGLRHPRFDSVQRDISWVDNWYPKSIELIPEHLRPFFIKKLAEYGITPLLNDSILRSWTSKI